MRRPRSSVALLDVRQKLRARALVAAKNPQHARRHGLGTLLLDPAHLDAQVAPLDHHSDPARCDHRVNRLRYLASHPLLKLKPARVCVDQARQLAQTDDLAVRHVADVRPPKEWKQVVLAHAVEGDVLHDDHVVEAVEGKQRIADDGRRIGCVALREISKGRSDSVGCFEEPLPAGVHTQLLQQRRDRLLELVTGRHRFGRDAHSRSTSTTLFSVSFKRTRSSRADGSCPSRRRQIAIATFSAVGRQPLSQGTSRFRWRWSTSWITRSFTIRSTSLKLITMPVFASTDPLTVTSSS